MAKSNLSKVDDAHGRRELFLEIHGRARLVEIRILYRMWKEKDYEKLGFENFKDYFQAPRDSGGLDLSLSWARELIYVYHKYIVELGLPEDILKTASPRKLYFLKDKVTKENVEEVLSQAKNMTLKHLMLEAAGAHSETCTHQWEKMQHCKKCDTWEKT